MSNVNSQNLLEDKRKLRKTVKRLVLLPIFLFASLLFIVFGVLEFLQEKKIQADIRDVFSREVTRQESVILEEIFFSSFNALSNRLESLETQLEQRFSGHGFCLRLQVKRLIESQGCDLADKSVVNSFKLKVGKSQVGLLSLGISEDKQFGGIVEKKLLEIFMITLLCSLILIFTIYNRLNKKILTPLIEGLQERTRESAFVEIAKQVSHDVKSPLAALDFALNTLPWDDAETKNLILMGHKRISEIVNSLENRVDFSEKATELVGSEQLATHIDKIITEKKSILGDRSNIRIVFDQIKVGDKFKVQINLGELSRILSNTINNSIEAIDKNGKIEVKLLKDEDTVLIVVEDNGVGIPSEMIEKVTQKGFSFNKKKKGSSGSGLGLYHAKKTLQQWGGHLSIVSHKGMGTKVFIELNSLSKRNAKDLGDLQH